MAISLKVSNVFDWRCQDYSNTIIWLPLTHKSHEMFVVLNYKDINIVIIMLDTLRLPFSRTMNFADFMDCWDLVSSKINGNSIMTHTY